MRQKLKQIIAVGSLVLGLSLMSGGYFVTMPGPVLAQTSTLASTPIPSSAATSLSLDKGFLVRAGQPELNPGFLVQSGPGPVDPDFYVKIAAVIP